MQFLSLQFRDKKLSTYVKIALGVNLTNSAQKTSSCRSVSIPTQQREPGWKIPREIPARERPCPSFPPIRLATISDRRKYPITTPVIYADNRHVVTERVSGLESPTTEENDHSKE